MWILTGVPDHLTAKIVGWGSFQSFYGCSAYDATAKISRYLVEAFREQGRSKALVAHGPAQTNFLDSSSPAMAYWQLQGVYQKERCFAIK